MQLLKRGAEAEIWLRGRSIVKKRVRKKYRQRKLDLLIRARRNRLEIRLMEKARRAGLRVPSIIRTGKYEFEMEYIDGAVLRDILNRDNCSMLAEMIGKGTAVLHSFNIIHGDLTTSNMILRKNELFFIDFGLGFISTSVEDKATDLHVFEETTKATHPELCETLINGVLAAYSTTYKDADAVLKRLERIRKRGRYMKS